VPSLLPVWREDECGKVASTEWLSPTSYVDLILAGADPGSPKQRDEKIDGDSSVAESSDSSVDEAARNRFLSGLPFATLTTITPSDVRVVTMVDRIFNGYPGSCHDRESRLNDINRVMRFLYHEHGCTLTEPEGRILLADDELTWPVILDYLRQLGELNRESADKIYDRLVNDTLSIIGTVHLRGGHFGGGTCSVGEDETVGVGWGGATAIRNMDILGGFHDLAAGCHFPWFPAPSRYSEHESEPYADKLKKRDLIYFAETAQWIRLVLFGAPYEPEMSFSTIQLGEDNDIFLCSADPSTPSIIEALSHLDSSESVESVRYLLFGR
jgi:hypothetical protein